MLTDLEKRRKFKLAYANKKKVEESYMEKRIALPTTDRLTVDEHFGHCKEFAIHIIQEKEVSQVEYVEAPAHAPGVLPKFLGEKNIHAIITGGMGQRAIDLFETQEIEVILGASGSIKDVIEQYIAGQLTSNGTPCVHDEDHNCNQ